VCLLTFQFSLGGEPKFDITPRGTIVLYPYFMGALTDQVALLQLIRSHFDLVGKFAERLNRPVVGDPHLQLSIAFGPSPKLAYFLHLATSGP
jgi:hypothetical protein